MNPVLYIVHYIANLEFISILPREIVCKKIISTSLTCEKWRFELNHVSKSHVKINELCQNVVKIPSINHVLMNESCGEMACKKSLHVMKIIKLCGKIATGSKMHMWKTWECQCHVIIHLKVMRSSVQYVMCLMKVIVKQCVHDTPQK